MRGAIESGHEVEKIRVQEKKVACCSTCYACQKTGRCKVRWDAKDGKPSLMDKVLGIGTIDAIYKLFKFEIDATYCYECKKMIIDTNLAN